MHEVVVKVEGNGKRRKRTMEDCGIKGASMIKHKSDSPTHVTHSDGGLERGGGGVGSRGGGGRS